MGAIDQSSVVCCMRTLADSIAASGHAGKHGIAEMLQTYRPGSKTMVVVMYAEDDCSRFDPARHAGQADFVVLTDARLPRSHEYFDIEAEAGGEAHP